MWQHTAGKPHGGPPDIPGPAAGRQRPTAGGRKLTVASTQLKSPQSATPQNPPEPPLPDTCSSTDSGAPQSNPARALDATLPPLLGASPTLTVAAEQQRRHPAVPKTWWTAVHSHNDICIHRRPCARSRGGLPDAEAALLQQACQASRTNDIRRSRRAGVARRGLRGWTAAAAEELCSRICASTVAQSARRARRKSRAVPRGCEREASTPT